MKDYSSKLSSHLVEDELIVATDLSGLTYTLKRGAYYLRTLVVKVKRTGAILSVDGAVLNADATLHSGIAAYEVVRFKDKVTEDLLVTYQCVDPSEYEANLVLATQLNTDKRSSQTQWPDIVNKPTVGVTRERMLSGWDIVGAEDVTAALANILSLVGKPRYTNAQLLNHLHEDFTVTALLPKVLPDTNATANTVEGIIEELYNRASELETPIGDYLGVSSSLNGEVDLTSPLPNTDAIWSVNENALVTVLDDQGLTKIYPLVTGDRVVYNAGENTFSVSLIGTLTTELGSQLDEVKGGYKELAYNSYPLLPTYNKNLVGSINELRGLIATLTISPKRHLKSLGVINADVDLTNDLAGGSDLLYRVVSDSVAILKVGGANVSTNVRAGDVILYNYPNNAHVHIALVNDADSVATGYSALSDLLASSYVVNTDPAITGSSGTVIDTLNATKVAIEDIPPVEASASPILQVTNPVTLINGVTNTSTSNYLYGFTVDATHELTLSGSTVQVDLSPGDIVIYDSTLESNHLIPKGSDLNHLQAVLDTYKLAMKSKLLVDTQLTDLATIATNMAYGESNLYKGIKLSSTGITNPNHVDLVTTLNSLILN